MLRSEWEKDFEERPSRTERLRSRDVNLQSSIAMHLTRLSDTCQVAFPRLSSGCGERETWARSESLLISGQSVLNEIGDKGGHFVSAGLNVSRKVAVRVSSRSLARLE